MKNMAELSKNSNESKIKSPGDFIKELPEILKKEDNADSDLIDILETYLLKESPTKDAFEKSVGDIKQLAEDRVNKNDGDEAIE